MGSLTSVHSILKDVCRKEGINLNLRYEALFLATTFGLVREGLGISIMPRSLMYDFDNRGMTAVKLIEPTTV